MPLLGKQDHPLFRRGRNRRESTLATEGNLAAFLEETRTVKLRTLTADSTEPSAPRTPRSRVRPLLSIVVPTKDEAGNVAALVARLEAVVPTVAMEIIFVDASSDGTPEPIEESAWRCSREVVLLRQRSERGRSGLGRRGRSGTARREGAMGLRHGRRPAAPARADRVAARAGRVAPTSTSSSQAATARTARPASAGRARWPLVPRRGQRGCCSRGASETSPIP